MGQEPLNEFEKAAAEKAQGESLLREFWDFLAANKLWWMVPILVSLGVLGLLVFLTQTAAAPFIYTLF
jgi:hypothetical protein